MPAEAAAGPAVDVDRMDYDQLLALGERLGTVKNPGCSPQVPRLRALEQLVHFHAQRCCR